MLSRFPSYIDLRRLILFFSIVVAIITLSNTLYSTYRVQRQHLIENTIEANRVYAAKLSATVDQFIFSAQQQILFSAKLLGEENHGGDMAEKEVFRLKYQTDSFNSVTVVDSDGFVVAVSPEMIKIKGVKLSTPGAVEALKERRSLVSKPYLSAAGNFVIIISSPIFNKSGRYLGYVGGTIYLKQKSILHDLIGSHFYRDESYIYIVDSDRTILYHPNKDKVGRKVGLNSVVDSVILGGSGGSSIVNSSGSAMLAGYSLINSVKWGVISQQSERIALSSLGDLILRTVLGLIPVAVLGIFGIFWLSGFISRPLRQLANCTNDMGNSNVLTKLVGVKSWYFEAAQIKKALLQGVSLMQEKIGKLNIQVKTDPLTGLLNRRALSNALDVLKVESRVFSIVSLDIDHFKNVNDTYGHDVGDLVLIKLAEIIRSCSRGSDYPCRVGGEEFLIILPDVSTKIALEFAERLRSTVERSEIEVVGSITISLGVATWPISGDEISDVLKVADEEMYEAKRLGRNRVSARAEEYAY